MEKKQMMKVTSTTGQVFFYNKAEERARIASLPGVARIEDVLLSDEEYAAIPASPEASRFFAGKLMGTRPE